MLKHLIPSAAIVALMAAPAAAQTPVSTAEAVTKTFTIEAIDHTARVVTLKGADAATTDIYCGAEVQRFDELKVGDKVTFKYYESLVSAIHRPEAGAKPPVSTGVTRTPGANPGGTIAKQMIAVVTLDAIDPKVGSVTIRTDDGHKFSAKVQDPKNLTGYKVGDKVEVTYTQALAISVTPAK